MDGNWHYVIFAVAAVIGIAVQLRVSRKRHQQDYREHLEPILTEHGLKFVSSVYPGPFKIGPFPSFEIQIGRPQSRIGGIKGEYDEYRVVTVMDADGTTYQLWANIEFELFILRRIRWRAENEENLPQRVKEILEN